MRQVEVPDRMRQALHDRLRTEKADLNRRHLRRLLRYGAVAAALLVLIGGVVWHFWQLPEVTAETVTADFQFVRSFTPGPEALDESFRQMGYETLVPRDNEVWYRHFAFHGLAEFQGKRVPALYFQSGNYIAQVRILSDRQFNFKGLGDCPQDEGYPKRLLVRFSPDRRYAYLIVYTGVDANWLLKKPLDEGA
jgi:hypothetical protein